MPEGIFRSKLEKADQTLSEIYDGTHLTGFRNDLEKIWIDNRKKGSAERGPEQLAADANRAADRLREDLLTIEDGVSKFQILDGITGGISVIIILQVFSWAGVGWIPSAVVSAVVFAVTTLLNHGILYTKAVVDRLAYLDSSAQEPPHLLEWKRAWNLKVLRSNSSIAGILIVALCRKVWQSAYLIGLEVVDDAFNEVFS
ncbi:hypothetical protein PM085_15925 [Halorubrum ezzemoulense]|uniref:Uncharacterized protein n=1 Tax=Halorubrum ezzemoulense TaxID=337243 RepID=A0ABT4Z6F3_HALEZ|nr:hypothetical protein [Halorubrum ezzemoulense]MDB2293746.1 hypothetical protein [Halorubrum ezzemoulense]